MKILIASPIDPNAIRNLREKHNVIIYYDATEEELKTLIQDRDLLIFRSGVNISAEVLRSAPDLKLLIRAGSGLDNVDLNYVKERGLDLVRIPSPSAQAVAEMAFAFMLALSRRLFEADKSMREGHWAKYELPGTLLAEKVLGIVGLGNTGTRVAEFGVAAGMEVIGCVEHPTQERAAGFAQKGIRLTDLEEVVSVSDYVSIHIPLKNSTYHLIDASIIARMKPGAVLINLGRGGVIDEHALHNALDGGGPLGGAALDVHEVEKENHFSPLVDCPNVILTPHIGATVIDTQRQIGRRLLAVVDSYTENGDMNVLVEKGIVDLVHFNNNNGGAQ
jgi:phosphoglycerate dehydrogenase-like enzyme